MWRRSIAFWKVHERPDVGQAKFDAYWFSARARTLPELPTGTEILHKVCGGDREKFDIVNYHLREAFDAGRRAK